VPMRHSFIAIVLTLICLVCAGPVQAGGEAVYVFDKDFPPFTYLEDGRPAGFEIELMQAAAKLAGVRLTLRPLPWGQAMGQVAVGHAQIISGLTPTPERRRLYLILEPANVTLRSLIYVREGGRIHNLADLAGRRVGAQRGSTHEGLLKAREGVTVVTFDSETLGLQALSEGQVDASAATGMSARHTIANLGLTGIVPLEEILALEPLHFAMALSQKALAESLGTALKTLRDNGEYERLRKRWLDK
jgi:ABC-type amino acid transport substrate-binding protein